MPEAEGGRPRRVCRPGRHVGLGERRGVLEALRERRPSRHGPLVGERPRAGPVRPGRRVRRVGDAVALALVGGFGAEEAPGPLRSVRRRPALAGPPRRPAPEAREPVGRDGCRPQVGLGERPVLAEAGRSVRREGVGETVARCREGRGAPVEAWRREGEEGVGEPVVGRRGARRVEGRGRCRAGRERVPVGRVRGARTPENPEPPGRARRGPPISRLGRRLTRRPRRRVGPPRPGLAVTRQAGRGPVEAGGPGRRARVGRVVARVAG